MLTAGLLQTFVDFIADGLQPNCRALLRRRYCYVGEGAVRCGTVPMLNTRRALDDVPFMNDPDRLSSFLIKAFVLVRGSRIEGFLRKPRCEVWLSCAFSPLVLEKSQLPKWRTCSVLRK
jgi:hypothetical protein